VKQSIVRLVDCLRHLAPTQLTEPVLITVAQLTVELSEVLFPINKKSTQKEPQTWFGELINQGVPNDVIGRLRIGTRESAEQATMAGARRTISPIASLGC
jgi:helicase